MYEQKIIDCFAKVIGDMIKKDYKELMLLYENNEEKTFQELKKIYKNICDIRVIK